MKLVNVKYNLNIDIKENEITVLILEKPEIRYQIVKELYYQGLGLDGSFVLSENDKIQKLSQKMEFILEPFSLDENGRKVLSQLYQEMELCCEEEFIEEKAEISAKILELMEKISIKMPYNITSSIDVSFAELCKIYNVKLESESDSFMDKMVSYIQVMNQLCGRRLFCFLNISHYMNEEQWKYFVEYIKYQKVYALFIEFYQSDVKHVDTVCIVDADYCIIDLNYSDLQHLPSDKFGENLKEFEV